MTQQPPIPPAPVPTPAPTRFAGVPSWVVLLVGILALIVATVALTATVVGHGLLGQIAATGPWGASGTGNGNGYGPGMMGGYGTDGSGYGTDGNGYGPGMMGGYGGPATGSELQPGDPGFVAGTVASPRVIDVIAGPGYTFSPSTIVVQRGETVTFRVTTMGPLVHEFMVGPADAVAADEEGTPEIADIGMMDTKTLTYTFDGSGPYAFACHADDHYQQGMRGTISVVG